MLIKEETGGSDGLVVSRSGSCRRGDGRRARETKLESVISLLSLDSRRCISLASVELRTCADEMGKLRRGGWWSTSKSRQQASAQGSQREERAQQPKLANRASALEQICESGHEKRRERHLNNRKAEG